MDLRNDVVNEFSWKTVKMYFRNQPILPIPDVVDLVKNSLHITWMDIDWFIRVVYEEIFQEILHPEYFPRYDFHQKRDGMAYDLIREFLIVHGIHGDMYTPRQYRDFAKSVGMDEIHVNQFTEKLALDVREQQIIRSQQFHKQDCR